MTIKDWAKEEIKSLGEIRAWNLQIKQESERKYDLITGLTLGLLFGIIGNLLIQFLYPAVERLALGIFDRVVLIDLIVSIVALIVIALVWIAYRKKLNRASKAADNAQSTIDLVDFQIRRMKLMLETGKFVGLTGAVVDENEERSSTG